MPSDGIALGSSVVGRGDLVVANIFADATAVARALGLDIELPDCDNEDPAYWERVHANGGYKRRIEGRIADPWLEGDLDWSLLLRLPWGEVWFDIEEGVKLFLPAAEIARALLLLDGLRAKGICLTGEDGKSRVWVSPTNSMTARWSGCAVNRRRRDWSKASTRSSGSCRRTGADSWKRMYRGEFIPAALETDRPLHHGVMPGEAGNAKNKTWMAGLRWHDGVKPQLARVDLSAAWYQIL